MENFVVACSQIENAVVERPNVFQGISVRRWPFIVIELIVKDFTIKKTTDQNAFFDEDVDIFQKQKRTHIVILVLDDVFNYVAHGSNLVVFQSTVNCWSVEKLTFVIRFLNFVFIEDRELSLKELFVLVTEKLVHGATIKRQNANHVWSIQFQKGFVKDIRVWLIVDKPKDIALGFANIQTLEK